MANELVLQELIDSTLNFLRNDTPPPQDLLDGEFYFRDDWLVKLPRTTQAFITALQHDEKNPERPLRCTVLAGKYFDRWETRKTIEDLDSAIALYVIALRYTKSDDPRRLSRLSATAFAYQAKWEREKDDHDLDMTVHFFDRAVIAAGSDHPDLPGYLTNLAYILNRRWLLSKEPHDRENARQTFAEAVEHSVDHPLYPQVLSNFGEFIRLSMDVVRKSTLEEAVDLQEQAVQSLRPGRDLPYGMIWRNAAIANHNLFKITLDERSSSKTIECYGESLAQTQERDPRFLAWNTEFAEHYVLRYQAWHRAEDLISALQSFNAVLNVNKKHFGAIIGKADILRMMASNESHKAEVRAHIIDACQLADDSIAYTAASSLSRGWAYFRASVIYSSRYELQGEAIFLDRAIELSNLSLQHTKHASFWEFCCWCGDLCHLRYIKSGSPDDLEQAFKAVRNAIVTLDEREAKGLANCHWILGKCYTSEYRRKARSEDLEEALKWLEVACNSSSIDSHALALTENDLANALTYKFHQAFDVRQLDRAIETYASSIDNLRKSGLDAHHDNFAMLRTGIGQAMVERYEHLGSQDDLKSAVESFRTCLKLTEISSSRYATRACNFSWSLQLMSILQKDVSLLEEAQSCLLNVLNSPIDPGNRLLRLAHLYMGNIYLSFYTTLKRVSELELAIEQYDHMETLSDDDSGPEAANNKALALHKKALATGDRQSYLDTIAKFDEVIDMKSYRPEKVIVTKINRAETFRDMYEQLQESHFGEEALREFSELALTNDARTDLRLRAAEVASALEISLNQNYKAAYMYTKRATEFLPHVVLLSSNRLEQMRLIRKYHRLPSNGTAFAAAADVQPARILADLEQSRAFIWERYLSLKTPLEALQKRHEHLANEFERLRSALLSQRPSASNGVLGAAVSQQAQLRMERGTHIKVYDELLVKIRQEKGFENFPLTYASDDLNVERNEADPIVYINLNSYRCDAVIMSLKGVSTLALKNVKWDDVFSQATHLYVAQTQLSKDFGMACKKFEQVMLWLWTAIARPVLEALNFNDFISESPRHKRVFWVSSGWLSVFPIHAAGDWTSSRNAEGRSSVQERVVSSYIPSIKALDFLRRRSKHLSILIGTGNALLVGMPETPEMKDSELDTELELTSISSLLGHDFPIEKLISPLPTTSDVKSALASCELAHFACHGVAESEDPSRSALRFADWKTKPFNVRMLLQMKLERCHLVVLSACETAANKDILLRDEGLHIAGAFNMAGVPHAVAGMWKIDDEASIALVQGFYKELFQEPSETRYKASTTALHTATEILRVKGLHPIIWGAFVHMGC